MNGIFDNLPCEVTSYLLSFLEAQHLAIFCETNKFMMALGSQPMLWRELCARKWPNQFIEGESTPRIQKEFGEDALFWKHYYVQKHLLSLSSSMTWTQISLTQSSLGGVKPSARYAHSGTVFDNKIVYIGGQLQQKKRFNDFFFYDTTTGHFTQPKIKGCPPNISKHTTMEIAGLFYTFGGYDGISERFELSVFDPVKRQWEAPATFGERPLSRSNHSSAVVGPNMYIFGGLLQQEEELIDSDDLHVLNTQTMTWTKLHPSGVLPEARCGHKMVTIDGKIYLFGGGNGDNWAMKFNDLHVYDPETNCWTKPETTGDEVDSTTFSSVWNVGRFLFVFGGGRKTHRGSVSNDIYALDTVTMHWTKQTLTGDAPSERDDCTTNVVGDTVYLMHGYNNGAIDQFWSIRMSSPFFRAVHQQEPPSKVLKESHSPLLSLSPSLRKVKNKICQSLSPFSLRRVRQ